MESYNAMLPAETVKQLQRLCLLGLVALFEGRRDYVVHDRLLILIKVETLKALMTQVRQELHVFHDDRCEWYLPRTAVLAQGNLRCLSPSRFVEEAFEQEFATTDPELAGEFEADETEKVRPVDAVRYDGW